MTLTSPAARQDARTALSSAAAHATPHGAVRAPDNAPAFRYDVAVVGLGYVGLPTALAYHAAGQRVLCVEASAARVEAITRRDVDLLNSDADRLALALCDPESFALSVDTAQLQRAAGVLVCVPTPVDEHLVPDLAPLERACATVVTHAVPGQTLVLTSTTYVGCTKDLLTLPLATRGLVAGSDVFVAFSAERIDPGRQHVHETVPRVIGGVTETCSAHAMNLLAGYAERLHLVGSAEAAELTKLFENSFRAVNIALANEFADICGALNLDVAEVIAAAATKPYGFMPFSPGPGVGGHCIPCDPHYLLWQLRRHRVAAPLLESAMTAVALRPQRVIRRARDILAADGRAVAGARILVLGASYKAGVADLRESPALEIIAGLASAGADVAYADSLVPSLRVSGTVMRSVTNPANETWDLVIAHTVHAHDEAGWLTGQQRVLDTTYRLEHLTHRDVL
jgi:nucleotide sugar dehydrogenase